MSADIKQRVDTSEGQNRGMYSLNNNTREKTSNYSQGMY